MIRAIAEYAFEISWEVCNKAGGINTVIKTKAPYMKGYYSNYFLIGPYFKVNADVEVQEQEPPLFLKNIFDELRTQGMECHFGTWQIRGEPEVILIDFKNCLEKKTG